MQDGLGDKVRDAGPPDTRPCCDLLRMAEKHCGSLMGIKWLEVEDRASGGYYLCSSR